MWRLMVIFSFPLFLHSMFCEANIKENEPGGFTQQQRSAVKPLFLTPYLQRGDFKKAQKLATVKLAGIGVPSFSGYFTVNQECGSNLFFWFFQAQTDWKNAPILLWLQGGPGGTSLIGLFDEIGPVQFVDGLKKRDFSWNEKINLLFIDQPVGAGYSFTELECYPTDQSEVSKDLYSALIQFYQMFPSLQSNSFYIVGQSYGGRYASSLAYAIHKSKESNAPEPYINLKGIMIGNGLMDVMYQCNYGDYLYQLGMIDDLQRDQYLEAEQELDKELEAENWLSAYITYANLDKSSNKYINTQNYLQDYVDEINTPACWQEYIQSTRVRMAIHVGNVTFSKINLDTYFSLVYDYVQPMKSTVEELLEHFPIVFYDGQQAVSTPHVMVVNFLRNLKWSGAQDYLNTARQQWCENGRLAGFVRSTHNLHEVLVRNAGQMVPQDQPEWAFQLVNSVTCSPPDNPLQLLPICQGE